MKPLFRILCTWIVTFLFIATRAQEVSIPDPGLAAAIRLTLQKPAGPITQTDMLLLTKLPAAGFNITNVQGIAAAKNLTELYLGGNSLGNLSLPTGLSKLRVLDLFHSQLTGVALPADMTNLVSISIEDNRATSLLLPPRLPQLTSLILRENRLPAITLPSDMTNLTTLRAELAGLGSLSLPVGLVRLTELSIDFNVLMQLELPGDMSSLRRLSVVDNQLTTLTIPPGMTNLSALILDGNPLAELVLPEALAETVLSNDVKRIRDSGIPVFTFSPSLELVRPRSFEGRVDFAVSGPPGAYSILGSTDLLTWAPVGSATNRVGKVVFDVLTVAGPTHRFYRATSLLTPSNMVFVPPNSFKMGSPTNEPDHSIFEGPQTTVTLTHGYWIAKYEVTQAEYLDVMGVNPSNFPEDLSGPVSSVSWADANLYCSKLTQRERADGRISSTAHYRLPTEAEWECAARAGTTTRFSYGDDLDYRQLDSYGWFLDLGNPILTVRPVGQKFPNAWGLYDVHGNVWEWCLDWYGSQVGGVAVDPPGPSGNADGFKVIRGGAYDYPNSSCRSAARLFYSGLAGLNDSDVGFRVVLIEEQEAPLDMAFIPPNTFTMGSPATEFQRQPNEGPETLVNLTRGFWIGKHEVTQGEYFMITGTNPSQFPGDLRRPVSSVSWPAATNYCHLLTQRELAAGKIPSGSKYRLPTEAEWECAARAGTTTRFSYGDDLTYTDLPNHAWFASNSGITVHPVGQKLPNAWGLYDMEGNVWEWCQDWLGDLPGGTVANPQGPDSNEIGFKVMRGGTFDSSGVDCRSARRGFFGNSPFLTDFTLGFRVVLIAEP